MIIYTKALEPKNYKLVQSTIRQKIPIKMSELAGAL